MNADELMQHIFGQSDLFSPSVSLWVKSSTKFASFVEKHQVKIRAKVKNTQKDCDPIERLEKLKDVCFELEVGYLLCKTDRFSVEYEQYGKKGPDFTVRDDTNIIFNVEVKRIRPGESHQVRFDLWESYVKRQIHSIPSTLAMCWILGDDLDLPLDLVDRLEEKTQEIVKFIANTIPVAEKAILTEGKHDFSIIVPNFENEFVLKFRKPPYTTKTLANNGGGSPIFKTGQEYRKFDAIYWKALNQGKPDMINILAINTDSKTHDSWALEICMQNLNELAKGNNIEKTKQLSGVLFRGAWLTANSDPNVLWCDEEAYYPIPEAISQDLRKMGDQ